MAYEFDVFLSYPRADPVGLWVHNHFYPELRDCLNIHLANPPRIFLDSAQPTGVEWPDNIKNALLKSRLLVAIWTPPYFRSSWCVGEWESMLEREKLFELHGTKPLRGLVYPVVYSDGNHFHLKAKQTQYRRDLSRFTYPYPTFRDSSAYLEFHDAMMSIAAEIEIHLNQIPNWQPNWPIATPELSPSDPVNLVML